ncbi:MKRN2 opposite strand protein-like [Mya arenaria]|uniref:MKRN2 opposite strand protein-like n=1 Tax=Mya arenaria TaxID=6604 RepID=UPI0022DF0189|nr:MKRN2 opposite strand protein-like [Mya arenaria]
MESEIRCFQHCKRDKNILCQTIPLVCPICRQDTLKTEMRIPPYLIDSPFIDASFTQCCVVIKPTIGSFLKDFTNQSDLHIGVTNSRGVVYEYDERGVTVGCQTWSDCLRVTVLDINSENSDFVKKWDQDLDLAAQESLWTAGKYTETSHNCYDFVMSFLNRLGLQATQRCLQDRRRFCEEMIVPVTARAGKFISLYRDIKRKGCVVQDVTV